MFAVQRKRDKHAFVFSGPQLGFSIPELFVELEVRAPGYEVRGVTAPGVPVMGIGHNGKVAWGITSGLSDDDDLYAEELVPGQPERYRFDGAERAMDCRDEVFAFRPPPSALLGLTGGKLPDLRSGQRTERICRTVHGPVQVREGDTAYARRYAIWGRELETIVGIDLLNRAETIHDVDRAMQDVTWNENVMAADSHGNIGFWHPGLHPLRPREFDERLPFPGTGEAEWRGLLPRSRTPKVINPRQGWLANWNNIPAEGWTAGDGPARERLSGEFHRVDVLNRLARNPTFEGSEAVIRRAGTIAQQRPTAKPRLVRAARGATGEAKAVLDLLLRWDGDYHRTDDEGTVHPGVATFEAFKEEASKLALAKLGAPRDTALLDGGASTSHEFDIRNGEAYALRTLSRAEYRAAAAAAFRRLSERFETGDVTRWREPRKMFAIAIQGAGSPPPLPFFDRGTWEQVVEVGP
jgi:penicillin amidase